MIWFALATRCLLSVVFLAAGLSKLLDLKGSRKAITEFGLPAWSASPLGIGLPIAEIVTAFLLLTTLDVWSGAICAFALSLAFSIAIAINILLGRNPECHCFGQVHSRPVGWETFARSSVLAFLAAVLAWHAQSHIEYSLRTITNVSATVLATVTTGLVVLVSLCSLFWLVLHLFRQNGRLLLRIEALESGQHRALPVTARPVFHGLPLGAQAVPFDLPVVAGGRATLADFLDRAKPILLISTDPKCGPCDTLMPDVAAWQKDLADDLTIVLLSHGRQADNRAKVAEHGLIDVLIEQDHKIAEQYHAVGTPTAVLIRNDGTIGSPAMSGPDAIRQLVVLKAWTQLGLVALMRALGYPLNPTPPVPAPSLPIGSAAPRFDLLDLNGKSVGAANLDGSETVMLFWNPSCGFCQRMLPQLKEWEVRKPPRAPRLVLISAGTVDLNRAMGLESSVLIDEGFVVGGMYGSRGTPSAILIDGNGRVASTLVVGAPVVLDLISGVKSDAAVAPVAPLSVGAS